jgi:MazG family protein
LGKELDRLIRLVAKLRSPRGCPWDREQTHQTLIPYLREEAMEVEHSLRAGSWHEIEDELGDLLLQILLHAQIKKEERRFDIEDIARSQYLKLKRRHPHVFGGARYKTADDVLADWKTIKTRERKQRAADVERRLKRKPKR